MIITDKNTCSGWLRSEIRFKSSQIHFAYYNQNRPFKSHNCSSGNIFSVLISDKVVIFKVSPSFLGNHWLEAFMPNSLVIASFYSGLKKKS